MGFLRKMLSGLAAPAGSVDASGLASAAAKEIDTLIDLYLREEPVSEDAWMGHRDPRTNSAGQKVLALDKDQQAEAVGALIVRLVRLDRQVEELRARQTERWRASSAPGWYKVWNARSALNNLLNALLTRKLPLGASRVAAMADWCALGRDLSTHWYPYSKLAAAAEQLAEEGDMDVAVTKSLTEVVKRFRSLSAHAELQKYGDKIDKALGQAPSIPIRAGDIWSDAALADIAAMKTGKQAAWSELLGLCRLATGAQPSAKWLNSAKKLVENLLSRQEFKDAVLRWFPLVDRPNSVEAEMHYGRALRHPLLIGDAHADILRGLAWTCGLFEDKEIARAVTALAISSYRKIPGMGPRLVKVGNACICALGTMPGMEGLGGMALLRVKVKFGTAQKMLDKALGVAAERLNLPKEELEEMAVPAYGLTEVGRAVWTFDDVTAELTIPDTKSTEIVWKNAAGKIQKSVPAKVKIDFAEDLKELKAAEKDIQKMLPAQAERIDQLYLQQKEWPLAVWRERYLDHPLVGVMARRLIWRFRAGEGMQDGIWQDGAMSGRDGRALDLTPETRVTLWHPLDVAPAEIQAWRLGLEEKQIRQPFKQAHREIYLLTPAEEATRVYSNRFAAHVLRQHQFNALAIGRGWKNKLRLMVDDSYPPACVNLEKWNLRAEFWIEGAGNEYGTDTNDSGTYLHLTTDQVRFYPLAAPQREAHAGGGGYAPARRVGEDAAVPLTEIPALVFSEVMRDVDLFVGVASVGNDPNWNDGGPQGRYRDYWNQVSFGDLGATAQTRKAILERLVPRLKIAEKCSFLEKFLVVRGALHTYKIHLGSGNILMSPNDQYLCIVASRSATASNDKVFLPFEGDQVMATILSKALLLADDEKIRDETINRQIRPQ